MSSGAPINIHPLDSQALLSQMRPGLVRFFRRRCKDLSQAEDLAQEVIVRTLNRADWTDVEQAKGYVFRAAANLWRDRQRRQLAHSGAEVVWEDEVALGVSEEIPLERIVFSKEELHRVSAALMGLSERTRDVFVLHRLEQLRYSAIAEMLNISVSAVEKHMSKALAYLACHVDASERMP